METRRLLISSTNAVDTETLQRVDDFMKDECSFAKKDNLHVRLLIEETLGMLKAMTGNYSAMLWIEAGKSNCRLHVLASSFMDINKKKELLSLSQGKNAYAKGFMAKLGDIIENGILNYENVMALQQKYGLGYVDVASMGGNPSEIMFSWSLNQYRKSLSDAEEGSETEQTAWDELEKSIVAKLAKDVQVGVKKDHVELLIDMDLTGK